jgi:hypothetical protein
LKSSTDATRSSRHARHPGASRPFSKKPADHEGRSEAGGTIARPRDFITTDVSLRR